VLHRLGRRAAAYGLAILFAYITYATLTLIIYFVPQMRGLGIGSGDVHSIVSVGSFFLAFDAFHWALIVLAAPWTFLVYFFGKLRTSGLIYFIVGGLLGTLLLGTVFSALGPKPLWIENQTFVEAFLIAVDRQGAIMAISGVVLGGTYWIWGESKVAGHPIKRV